MNRPERQLSVRSLGSCGGLFYIPVPKRHVSKEEVAGMGGGRIWTAFELLYSVHFTAYSSWGSGIKFMIKMSYLRSLVEHD